MSTHNIPFFNMKKKNTRNYPKSAAMGFFQGTQERVRKSHGKRAISVRAIEVLLYIEARKKNRLKLPRDLRGESISNQPN